MRKKMWEQLGQLEDRASPVLDQIRRDEQANSKGSPEKLATRAGRSMGEEVVWQNLLGNWIFFRKFVWILYVQESRSIFHDEYTPLSHFDAFNECLFLSDFSCKL